MSQDSGDLQVAQLPLRVTNIQVEGVKHTSPKVPVAYLHILNDCRSFKQLNSALKVVNHHMMGTGLYSDVQFAILPGNANHDFATEVRVFCEVQERNRWHADVAVDQMFDPSMPNLKVGVALNNPINGLGENLNVSVTRGASGAVKAAGLELKDLYNGINSRIKYNIGIDTNTQRREWQGNTEQTVDRLVLGGTTYDDTTSIQFELQQRKAQSLTQIATGGADNGLNDAKIADPTDLLHNPVNQSSLKSAIKYIKTEDSRDIPFNPHRGQYYKVLGELSAGLSENPAIRTEVHYQYHQPLNSRYSTFSYSFRGGFQTPFRTLFNLITNNHVNNNDFFDVNAEFPEIPIFDRFLAEPTFTRGLTAQDMGPKAARTPLGADAYATATVSASTIIPRLEDLPIRPHVFANATHMSSLTHLARHYYGGRDFGAVEPTQFTASIGAGIVFPTIFGRGELNLASQIKNTKLMKPKLSFHTTLDW